MTRAMHKTCTGWAIEFDWGLARAWFYVRDLRQAGFMPGTYEGSVLYGDLRGVGFIGVFEFWCFLTQNLVHMY